ncbi:MAG: insulinase family protein [Thermoanaerobaculia bacterium]|nr:insulinase family protein [Thermoanaerobaculia bacterium]
MTKVIEKTKPFATILLPAILLLSGWGIFPVEAAEAAEEIPESWEEIEAPPLPEFEIPEPKRIELGNGLVIFLQEDHELPLIRGIVSIRGGSRDEPAAKTGLVSIYGQAWRTGGTESKTGDELDRFLESRAAEVESSGDRDSTSLSWDSLAEDFGEVFPVVVDLLENPAFREEKIDLAKEQVRTGIARRNDDPRGIAAREARQLVYGELSPYARVPEYDTVAAVGREDLLEWHEGTVHPNNMVIGVTGDFDPAQMEKTLREAFGDWPRGPEVEVPEIPVKMADPGIYLVKKEDVTQSNIRFVHPGIVRSNPDYWAVRVMNEIFGGGFAARLFSHIRSDRGLAYSVGGGVGSAYDHPGMFSISMGTKSGSTLESIQALYGEIDKLQEGPITEEEMSLAQESLLNSFVFNFDSREEILREKMALEFYGYPLDFVDRFPEEIRNVTRDEVQRVAREYIDPEKIAVLVVGKPSEFDGELSELGEVEELDITIPEPSAGEEEAVTANDAGRELMALAVEGMGGQSAVDGVQALRIQGSVDAQTPQGPMTLEIVSLERFPDSVRQTMTMPMGEMTMVATPEEAFMVTPMGTRPLPGSQKEELLKELRKEPLLIAQRWDEEEYPVADAGAEEVDGTEARILDVEVDGKRIRWFLDPESGRILQTEAKTTDRTGAVVTQRTVYSDYREVDGLMRPFHVVIYQDDEESSTVTISEVQVNPEIPEGTFVKPE